MGHFISSEMYLSLFSQTMCWDDVTKAGHKQKGLDGRAKACHNGKQSPLTIALGSTSLLQKTSFVAVQTPSQAMLIVPTMSNSSRTNTTDAHTLVGKKA